MFNRFFGLSAKAASAPTQTLMIQMLQAFSAHHNLTNNYYKAHWRRLNFKVTLVRLASAENLIKMQTQVGINLNKWRIHSNPSPSIVQVIHSDWVKATSDATRSYAKIYAVLNPADPVFPGGKVFKNEHHLEEKIWHSSTCALSLGQPGVYFNKKNNRFYYDKTMQDMVLAKKALSRHERTLLSSKRGEEIPKSFKVYLNTHRDICFKGPEIIVESAVDKADATLDVNILLSHRPLPASELFPFHELRSSAPNRHDNHSFWKYNLNSKYYGKCLRTRIAAQLDTLILHDIEHAILNAWGCDQSYQNNPILIAKIYKEEIEKRANCFSHIVFSIPNELEQQLELYSIFKHHLDGIKLTSDLGKTSKLEVSI